MQWIDEMFVNMEKERAAAALSKGSANSARVNQTKHLKKQMPGALNAWSALVSSITSDINEFNKHKERAGQTPVRMSQRRFECEVHLPGMHGKSLVLTLDGKDLQVSVHPDFPKQPLTITIELDQAGQQRFLGSRRIYQRKLKAIRRAIIRVSAEAGSLVRGYRQRDVTPVGFLVFLSRCSL